MPRVLCIEQDEALRARMRALLEPEGFAVDSTASGLEGIARALTLPPDLVLADVHLPDMEGYELAARLKREHDLENVPFLAVGDSSEERDTALAAGADGFIQRRIPGDLPGEVRAFMAGKRERLPEEGEREQLRALSGSMAARLESAVASERRATARLVELDRLKSAFMNNLAHELSTPLTPLAGYLRILKGGKLGPLAAQQQRVLDATLQAVTRLTRIVDNLSDFASLEAGRAPILLGEVDPGRLADEVVAELGPAIKEARLHVTVAHEGGGPIVADARKLRQAVANLVSNAVKFSPHDDGPDRLSTLAELPAGRMVGKPLYVLTSSGTASAAEEFAGHVGGFRIGELIGDTTGGAGFRNTLVPVPGGFVLSVSIGRAVLASTGRDWEAVGIAPTTRTPVGQALEIAQVHALQGMMASASPERRPALTALADTLAARLEPRAPALPLAAYAGAFGSRNITLDDGRLYYQRETRPRTALIPLGQNRFALEVDPATRVTFVTEGARATAMEFGPAAGPPMGRFERTP